MVIVIDVFGCIVIGQVEVGIIIGLLANIECVDDFVVYCIVFNSSKICGILVYGFYIGNMFNNWISEKYWIIFDIDFKEYLNGMVVMNVIVVNKLNVNLIFYINVVFVGWIYVMFFNSLKENIQCVGDLDNSDWYYYIVIKGNMIGVGDLVGVWVFFDCVGFVFQVGIGVNLNDVSKFGVFGWLNFYINSQFVNGLMFKVGVMGDFNINFFGVMLLEELVSGCFEICVGEFVELFVNVIVGMFGYIYVWSIGLINV